MKKIKIFYHSGAGSSKTVGEIFQKSLSDNFDVSIKRVGQDYDYEEIYDCDFLIFGAPVYGFDVSSSMKDFVEKMPVFEEEKKCFIYLTKAFYSGNSTRRLSKMLHDKNIKTTGYLEIKSPASDGALVFPSSWKWVRKFEKNTVSEIKKSVLKIEEAISSYSAKSVIPANKFYLGIIEKPLLFMALKQEKKFIMSMHILSVRCTKCNYCVNFCKRGAWQKDESYPVFRYENCEFCLGCVHHCPNKAITFSDKYKDASRLDNRFFEEQKKILSD